MKIKSKTLFLKPFIGKLASEANSKPVFSINALRITNNTVLEGFKRNVTLAAKKYTFSFFMTKGLEDLNDKEYFSVDILNSTNAIVYTYTTKVNATGYYNFDYTATTAGTYTWRFRRVSLNGRSTAGTAYFDDFKVSYNTQQSQQVCSAPKNYRFGFNTQEKDDEVYGAGNLNTAEFWEYDTRIGRRWNVDPIVKPWESGYATFYNNPNMYTDVLGLTGTPTNEPAPADAGTPKSGPLSKKQKVGEVEIKFKRPNGKSKAESAPTSSETPSPTTDETSSKRKVPYTTYGYSYEECTNYAKIELSIATALLPIGEIFHLGKVGSFIAKGITNTSIDYLAQKTAGSDINYTSLMTSFTMQGTGLGHLALKNLINSHLTSGFNKKGNFDINPDGYNFGSAMFNTGVGFAFDKAFIAGSGLNPQSFWGANTMGTYTRAKNLSQSLTKTATAREINAQLAKNLEFRMRMAILFKSSTSGSAPDYLKGVVTNKLSLSPDEK